MLEGKNALQRNSGLRREECKLSIYPKINFIKHWYFNQRQGNLWWIIFYLDCLHDLGWEDLDVKLVFRSHPPRIHGQRCEQHATWWPAPFPLVCGLSFSTWMDYLIICVQTRPWATLRNRRFLVRCIHIWGQLPHHVPTETELAISKSSNSTTLLAVQYEALKPCHLETYMYSSNRFYFFLFLLFSHSGKLFDMGCIVQNKWSGLTWKLHLHQTEVPQQIV